MSCVTVNISCESQSPTGNGDTPIPPPPSPVSIFSQTVGDGTATSFTVTHDLDSDFVLTQVRHVPSGEVRNVSPMVVILDNNSVRLDFSAAPALDEYEIRVMAVNM